MKEAAARIKINRLLEAAGWRFFADEKGPANIQLEPSVALTKQALDHLGDNFEKATKGFIDFLLLNEKGFPFIVLEAKSEDKSPLVGKEQARKYCQRQLLTRGVPANQRMSVDVLTVIELFQMWQLKLGLVINAPAMESLSAVAREALESLLNENVLAKAGLSLVKTGQIIAPDFNDAVLLTKPHVDALRTLVGKRTLPALPA